MFCVHKGMGWVQQRAEERWESSEAKTVWNADTGTATVTSGHGTQGSLTGGHSGEQTP